MTVLQLHNGTLDLDLGVVETIGESVRRTTTELSLVRYLVARAAQKAHGPPQPPSVP